MSALIDLLDMPKGGFVLVTGLPGAGKSTFALRSQLHQLLDRGGDCVSIVTEQAPDSTRHYMAQLDTRFADREKLPLHFVDAYRGTVGIKAEEGVEASCGDLNSISLGISQALKKSDQSDLLITLDSLTPIYMLNAGAAKRFVQAVLGKYRAEGFRVLATIDEGVAKPEDATTIMSMATGILKIRIEADQSFIDVLKHPTIKVSRVELPLSEKANPFRSRLELVQNPETFSAHYLPVTKAKCRTRMPDYVHILWLQLAWWGGMLWDPKRFPNLMYENHRDEIIQTVQVTKKIMPWHTKLMMSIMLRFTDISKPKQNARIGKSTLDALREQGVVVAVQLMDESKYGELHQKVTEHAQSWGAPNVGRKLCFSMAAGAAGWFTGVDRSGSEWNEYETQCVGEGAEYCEHVTVRGRPVEVDEYLSGMNYSEVEPIIDSLIQRSVLLILEGKDEMVRPTLGSDVHLWLFQSHTSVLALSNERYMVAMRLSGVHMGKRLAKELLNRGVAKHDASKYLVNFLKSVKAGDAVMGDTIKIYDCAESAGIKIGEHLCLFTTGFLSGFLEEAGDRKVTKVKCIAAGDNVCEWTY